MLAANSDHPCYGLITSGGSFMFVKLVQGKPPRYAVSRLFGIRTPSDLYNVFSISKQLGQFIS
jgi:hypothetical protein